MASDAQPASNGEVSIDSYDLMPKLAANLDRHMVFPLLEFTASQLVDEESNVVKDEKKMREITQAKFELLKKTDMTDYVANLYCELEGLKEPPVEFADKKQKVFSQLEKYEQETAKITELLQRDDVINNLRSDKVANLEFLKREHEVTIEMVDALYDFGNLQYSCGNYADASEVLHRFRVLSTDNDKVAYATWGRLACETLTMNWESAMEEVQKVRESIDSRLANNPLAQLEHRTALIHWALFPLFNFEKAREPILELFFNAGFINTIQANCPWILRYLAVAVITGRGRSKNQGIQQKQMKDIVRIVKQESYEYQDPVTRFVHALCVDFDFEEAQHQLVLAEEVLRRDFFLLGTADDFVDAARHLIFESYCKIHSRITLKDLSARLGLNKDDAEKWIVNLIRDTRLDAKIDYQEGTVVMNHPPSSVYQQVIERTKGGFFRTQVLSAAVAR
ncbi:eukaryotic translation initiation factor 3 subunit 6 [Lasiosphaeria miniovina]|uniref:Eukaryotic translation initiation factor 3 subunit E n=1 Tax=Lasiosphaeria miniovina TaxID=1954250 RepID=A0AA40DQR1_9PEZI|nr:eukaryotic translation initiation factor 3 subunit 6 [Lasiosphaeria miniovina]KAK0712639.1 eukaryotic translation initiation factor 3 subunit 6 [Lasiosphaeria miniovina]